MLFGCSSQSKRGWPASCHLKLWQSANVNSKRFCKILSKSEAGRWVREQKRLEYAKKNMVPPCCSALPLTFSTHLHCYMLFGCSSQSKRGWPASCHLKLWQSANVNSKRFCKILSEKLAGPTVTASGNHRKTVRLAKTFEKNGQ